SLKFPPPVADDVGNLVEESNFSQEVVLAWRSVRSTLAQNSNGTVGWPRLANLAKLGGKSEKIGRAGLNLMRKLLYFGDIAVASACRCAATVSCNTPGRGPIPLTGITWNHLCLLEAPWTMSESEERTGIEPRPCTEARGIEEEEPPGKP